MDLLNRLFVAGSGGRVKPSTTAAAPVGKASVVIPCYNYARYLEASVGSIRGNGDLAVEIIIVDDCSTDDSLAVANRLAAADSRIRVVPNEKNLGHIATYNKGLALATGDYVILLSADDLLAEGALARAARLLAAEPSVGLVYGRTIDFRGNPPPVSTSDRPDWYVWNGHDWLTARCKAGYNVVPTPSVVMRTSVLRRIGGYRPELPHAGDFEMWLRTAAVSDIAFVAEVQAYYRLHDINMHKRDFDSGTSRGELIDLGQRWDSFRLMFDAMAPDLPDAPQLRELAARSMAAGVLSRMSHAYARRTPNFPFSEFEAFAAAIYPYYKSLPEARTLARRRLVLKAAFLFQPFWFLVAVVRRIRWEFLRYRRLEVGI